MNRTGGTILALTDGFGRSALRQPVYTALLLIPPLMGLLIRPLLMLLQRYLTPFDIEPWIPLFLAVTACFPPYLFGLLAALMLLDERDADLLPAFRVTPVPDGALLAAKVLPAALLSLIGVPVTLILSGEVHQIPVWSSAALGLLTAPAAVFYTLLITALSRSKVQALTAGKLLGTTLAVPVALALLSTPWRFMFLVFPSSWIAAPLIESTRGIHWFIGGLLVNGGLALWAWKFSLKRYFT